MQRVRVSLPLAAACAAAVVLGAAGCGVVTTASANAASGNFPGSKPIEIVSWSAAGSPKDVMARQVAKALGHDKGWKFVVTDRTGGDGAVAMNYLMSKPADGHTLIAAAGSMDVSLLTDLKSQFSNDDFTFVSEIQTDPEVLAVPAGSHIRSLADAKKAGNLKVAGFGSQSQEHVGAARIAKATGISMTWVPFKGGSEAVAAALGNNVDAVFTQVSAVYDLVKVGKLRVLGVTTQQPVPGLQAPTFVSLGYPDLVFDLWRGIIVKKGTPQSIVDTLARALKSMPNNSGYSQYVQKSHIAVAYKAPGAFRQYVQSDEQADSRYLSLITG